MALEITKENILSRKFYAATLADFDRLIEAAANGSTRAKLDLGKKMEQSVANSVIDGVIVGPLAYEPVCRQALAIYEELGEAGIVEAMERAVVLYAEGSTNSRLSVEPGKTPGTTTLVCKPIPDLTKAYQWCARAQQAGSAWAAQTLPKIEDLIVKDVMRGPHA